jgi:hypothetical protein
METVCKVLVASGTLATNVNTRRSLLSVIAPGTLAPLATVIEPAPTLEGSISSLSIATICVFMGAPIVPFGGLMRVTAGGVVSAPAKLVVKLDRKLEEATFPARSSKEKPRSR